MLKQNMFCGQTGNLLLIVFLFFILPPETIAQQWHFSPARARTVNDAHIFNKQQIVLAGGNEFNDSIQSVFTSGNNGLSWDIKTDEVSSWLKSMYFTDSLNGIAVGFNGKILKSINSGNTWQKITPPLYTRHFNKIMFTGQQTAFIAGGSVSDTMQTILKSTDGGNTWFVALDQPGFWLKSIAFSDALHGFAAGDSGTILSTADGGNTWMPVTSPTLRNFNAITFLNADTGFIAGGDRGDTMRTILQTTDGGLNWNILMDEPGGWLTDIHFVNKDIGYITGEFATLLKTINSGFSWQTETVQGADSTSYFNTVRFLDENFGLIGGRLGRVYIYTNSVLPQVNTTGADVLGPAQVKLNGTINSNNEPALYYFSIADNPALSNSNETFPINIYSDTDFPVQGNIGALTLNSTFYYSINARTLAGTSHGDTLSFFYGPPYLEFRTEGVNNMGASAIINGSVNNFPDLPLDLFFEYGTTPALGNIIPATPATITDAGNYSVSDTIAPLTLYTRYYYRLKGVTNNREYYGDMLSFIAGQVFTELRALNVTNVTDTGLTVNGLIDKFRFPVQLSFEYGITGQPPLTVNATPDFVNDTLPHFLTANITGLQPYTEYYARVKAITSIETFVSPEVTFNSTFSFLNFKTLPASDITGSSAQINAFAEGLNKPASLSFEYGSTTAFGNVIAAIPGTINDGGTYTITNFITGLQPDTYYYYRLRANVSGNFVYSDIRKFYTGESAILNWDFQFWEKDTFLLPGKWNVVGTNFERVPGSSGNYALKISNTTLAINGSFVSEDDMPVFFGGAPFTERPDSIKLNLNYEIAPGKTGLILIQLYTSSGDIVAGDFNFLSGNSGGTFKQVSFPVNYLSSLTPDSIVIGLIPIFPNVIENQNYIIIDGIQATPSGTQIPFTDFEDWFEYPHLSLLNWSYIKHINVDESNLNKPGIVTQGFFNPPYDYAAEIRNLSFPGGKWFCGELSHRENDISEQGGIPVQDRYESLVGYYKWQPANGDSLEIIIDLTYQGQEIGRGEFYSDIAVDEFRIFEIPIQYNVQSVIPDTAYISIRPCTGEARGPSVLTIDKLAFDGFPRSVIDTPTTVRKLHPENIKIYPNPAKTFVVIETFTPAKENHWVQIFDIGGRLVKEIKFSDENSKLLVSTADLHAGFYILRLKSGEKQFNKKLIIGE